MDTWFSSALWPFSTLGWPENTRELQAWNPGAVLCTAREIITLWVSRMVMTNLYFLDRLPFYHVYIHAMIQDGQGRKMSKSLGNGVDPVEIIEKYGADAMRYSLAYLTTGMQDIRMPVKMEKLPDGREINTSERFDIGRNFANKIWNAARFVMMNIEDAPAPRPLDVKQLAHEDRWILSRLNQTVSEMTADLDRYEFSDSAAGIYRFFWNELCDWYLEWIKPRMKENGPSKAQAQQVLAYGLDQTLRLLHPSMPYLTEQLWQYLNEICPSRMIDRPLEIDKGLVRSRWPQVRDGWTDASAERDMDLLQSSIRAFRDVRTNVNRIRSANKEKSLNDLPQAVVSCPPGLESFFNRTKSTIAMLGYLADLKVELNAAIPSGSTVKVVTDAAGQSANLIVPLAGLIDIDQERTRIVKELSDLDGHIARSEQRLSNQNFVTKAPPKVLEEHRQKLDELKARRDSLRQALAELK